MAIIAMLVSFLAVFFSKMFNAVGCIITITLCVTKTDHVKIKNHVSRHLKMMLSGSYQDVPGWKLSKLQPTIKSFEHN